MRSWTRPPPSAPHLHLTSPAHVLELAQDAVRARKAIRAQGHGLAGGALTDLVARTMADPSVLLSDVRQRLLNSPVLG